MKETFYGTHIIHIVCPALGASLANIIIYRGVALGMFLLLASSINEFVQNIVNILHDARVEVVTSDHAITTTE